MSSFLLLVGRGPSGPAGTPLPVSGPFADLPAKTSGGLPNLTYTSGSHNLKSTRRVTPAYYNGVALSGGAIVRANNSLDACQFYLVNTLTVSGSVGATISVAGDGGEQRDNGTTDGGAGGSGASGGGGGGGATSSGFTSGGNAGFGTDGAPGDTGDEGPGGAGGFGWAFANWVFDGTPLAYPVTSDTGYSFGNGGPGNGGQDVFSGGSGSGGGAGGGILVIAANSYSQTGTGKLTIDLSGGSSFAVGGNDGVAMIGFVNYDGSLINISGGSNTGAVNLYQILSDGTWILQATASTGFGTTIGAGAWGTGAGANLPIVTGGPFSGAVPIAGLPSLVDSSGSFDVAPVTRRLSSGNYRDIIVSNGTTLFSSQPDYAQFYWADTLYLNGSNLSCIGDNASSGGGINGDDGAPGAAGGGGGGGTSLSSDPAGGAGGTVGGDPDGQPGEDGSVGAGGAGGNGYSDWASDGFTYPTNPQMGGSGDDGFPDHGGTAGGGAGGIVVITCNQFVIEVQALQSSIQCYGGYGTDGQPASDGTILIYARHCQGGYNLITSSVLFLYQINDDGSTTPRTLSDTW